jgi:hypothetical protein
MSQPDNVEFQQFAYSTEFTPTQQGFRITIKVRSNNKEDVINLPFTIWEQQLQLAKDKHMTLAPHMEPEDPDELRKKLEETAKHHEKEGNSKTQKSG